MPNIKSSKKRVAIIAKKTLENKSIRSEMTTAIKKFNAVIMTGNVQEAEKLLSTTFSIIDSACASGIVHKNNAARKKSAIASKLRDLKSGKLVVTVEKKARVKAEAKTEAKEEVKAEAAPKAEVKKEKKTDKADKKAVKPEAKPEKKEKKAKKDAE